ncbi:MAG TPA: hypothetical protein PLZ31_12345 [Myxococcota bacterium]|nr:hypothetical protein [Myxococcota bacterium]HNZ04390.1 hypothetical protein [Myxococcota bacterium]HOD07325.1 hypothetical protein [Myxococcota bacterium]HPB51993.1 hypothetical protein [Myxococcota bacterium]
MASNDSPGVELSVAVIIEPRLPFVNQLLDMVRDVRKILGRDVRAVWMPPQSYCVVLASAVLPARAREEVATMGLRSGVTKLRGLREVELRVDPPVFERLPDGSAFIQSRVWSDMPEFKEMLQALTSGLESTGLEIREGVGVPGGFRFVFGWVPGPCDLPAIPVESLSNLPSLVRVSGLSSAVLSKVGATPMLSYRRLRSIDFDDAVFGDL